MFSPPSARLKMLASIASRRTAGSRDRVDALSAAETLVERDDRDLGVDVEPRERTEDEQENAQSDNDEADLASHAHSSQD